LTVKNANTNHLARTKQIIKSYRRRPHHISPAVDMTARLIVAIIGGLLLLTPMTILCYLIDVKWVLLVTFLFMIFFSIVVSMLS
jgi:hypothetical protein